jgi:protein deglycase
MTKVLVPLAPGCEELESVTLIDILRRGGLTVVTASLDGKPVKASRGVVLVADTTLETAMTDAGFDMVVVPGGMGGSTALAKHAGFVAYVRDMYEAGKYVGAICAAPIILGKAGLLDGHAFTAYPGVLQDTDFPGSRYTGAAVEVDGRVLTSRGPGTALDFSLILVGILAGADVRDRVEKELVRS